MDLLAPQNQASILSVAQQPPRRPGIPPPTSDFSSAIPSSASDRQADTPVSRDMSQQIDKNLEHVDIGDPDAHYAYMMKIMQENPDYYKDMYLPAQHPFTGKSHAETMRLSRLADALNARYYRGPRKPYSIVSQEGGGRTVTGGDVGQLYQMPFATEEMREMDRGRQLDLQLKIAELQRQQGLMNIPLEQQRAQLQKLLEDSKLMTQEQIRQFMVRWDYSHNYQIMARNERFRRSIEVWSKVNLPRYQADVITRVARQQPELADALFVLMGISAGAPTPEKLAASEAVARALDAAGDDPRARSMAVYNTYMQLGIDTVATMADRAITDVEQIVRNVYNQGLQGLSTPRP